MLHFRAVIGWAFSMSDTKQKKVGIILTLNFTRGAVEETQIWRHSGARPNWIGGAPYNREIWKNGWNRRIINLPLSWQIIIKLAHVRFNSRITCKLPRAPYSPRHQVAPIFTTPMFGPYPSSRQIKSSSIFTTYPFLRVVIIRGSRSRPRHLLRRCRRRPRVARIWCRRRSCRCLAALLHVGACLLAIWKWVWICHDQLDLIGGRAAWRKVECVGVWCGDWWIEVDQKLFC